MWAPFVVVADVGAKDPFEVALVHDQQVVEALVADRADKSLGVSVGIRSLKGRLEHSGAFGLEDFIEGGRELGVAIL